jgi:hypothetical protein
MLLLLLLLLLLLGASHTAEWSDGRARLLGSVVL